MLRFTGNTLASASNRLFQPSPIDALADVEHLSGRYLEIWRYGRAALPAIEPLSYLPNLISGELGHAVAFASIISAVAQLVRFIFRFRRPAQIIDAIIGLVAIPMRSEWFIGRRWSVESAADENVKSVRRPLKTQRYIAVWLGRSLEYIALSRPEFPANTPNASQATDLIVRADIYGSPFLLLGKFYRKLLSHLAPLMREVRLGAVAVASGGRLCILSSVA